MAPVLGTILRMAGRGGKISDDFNRTLTGSLGSTSVGAFAWSVVTGTWDVNGSRPVTATSQSSNPLATINPNLANVDAQVVAGAGDALYFRVQNATNWWRILWEGYQTSSCQTCCSTCCSTCYESCSKQERHCENGRCSCCDCGGCPCACGSGVYCAYTACYVSCNPYSCNCYSCNCYSCNCVYYDNYRALLQKMVGGTLTTIQTGTIQATPTTTTLKVSLNGQGITAYVAGSSFYTGTQADLAGNTQAGIGRGASNYNTSALDNFELSWK